MENRVLFSNILKKIIKEEVDARVEKCKLEMAEENLKLRADLVRLCETTEGGLRSLNKEVKELTDAVTEDIEIVRKKIRENDSSCSTLRNALSRIEAVQEIYKNLLSNLVLEIEKGTK